MPHSTNTESFDLGVLAKFVYELNITRRQILIYPPHHPLIDQALDNAMRYLNQVLEFNPILELGIAEDKLLLGNGVLDQNNPVFKDFAKSLFAHQIATLRFSWGVTSEQLNRFCQVLASDRNELAQRGGAATVLAENDVINIVLTHVDYGAFSSQELSDDTTLSQQVVQKNQSTLWQRFITGMTEGTLSHDGQGHYAAIDPNWLATVLNERGDEENEQLWKQNYDTTISSFIEELAKEEHPDPQELQQLNSLINSLSKPLRRQFLTSAFRTPTISSQLTTELAAQLSRNELLDMLQQVTHNNQCLPTNVMAILNSLSHDGQPSSVVSGQSALEQHDIQQRMQGVLSQDTAANYVPAAYQQLMERIIKAPPPSTATPHHAQLLSDLEATTIEKKNLDIMFMLLQLTETPPYDAIRNNLTELCDLAIDTGDIQLLCHCHKTLHELNHCADSHQEFCLNLLSHFEQPTFIDQLLTALTVWGKSSYPLVQELLQRIGEPTIPRLLDRLATESTAALRRYYMQILSTFGALCIVPIIERLDDHRWYYVRNLLIILQKIDQPLNLDSLSPLEHHPHPRVWQELMNLYRQKAPHHAEHHLIDQLLNIEANHHGTAIQLSGKHVSTATIGALIELLNSQPLNRDTIEHKIAIIQALAQTCNPEARQELESLRYSNILRHPLLHKRIHNVATQALALFSSPQKFPPPHREEMP